MPYSECLSVSEQDPRAADTADFRPGLSLAAACIYVRRDGDILQECVSTCMQIITLNSNIIHIT